MEVGRTGRRPSWRGVVWAVALAWAALALAACAPVDTGYRDPWHAKLAAAGILEKSATLGAVVFDYAEGPDNGPPLLLLHAQHLDWYSYSRVLPELSTSFHVFAVSYHGHGKTRSTDATLDAGHIGADLGAFIETVIKAPTFVTGNSSGGLLATWLASNRPGLVRAVLLEDPPLFSSEYPRVQKTVAYKTFSTCHSYLASGETGDFLDYWLTTNQAFLDRNAGKGSLGILLKAIRAYRAANPGQAVELNFLPDILRLLVRGLDQYDPRFGDAFYDGRWNAGFNHAEALERITCPVLLLQANFSIMADGTLNGAMDEADAAQAMALLPKGRYQRIDAAHTIHLDQPGEFAALAKAFFLD